jgi:hypothetical protein
MKPIELTDGQEQFHKDNDVNSGFNRWVFRKMAEGTSEYRDKKTQGRPTVYYLETQNGTCISCCSQ